MRLALRPVASTAIALALLVTASPALAADELNALIWCDHADPDLLQPFEEANDVRVNVKEYEGTGAGLAIVEQSQPGDWDVMVIDSVDVPRVAGQGLFAELSEDQLPFASLFPEVVLDDFTKHDGKRYAITEKFGYNSISYNKDAVDPAEMTSLNVLLDESYQGKIAIYDY
ncbi:MAG: extracellular solute-binding protein, partial [Geminicoccaceae bacterium]